MRISTFRIEKDKYNVCAEVIHDNSIVLVDISKVYLDIDAIKIESNATTFQEYVCDFDRFASYSKALDEAVDAIERENKLL